MESRPSKEAMVAMAETESRIRHKATIVKAAEEAAIAAAQAVQDAFVAAEAERERARAKKEADALAKEEAEEKAALGGWEEQPFDAEVTLSSLSLPPSLSSTPRSVRIPCSPDVNQALSLSGTRARRPGPPPHGADVRADSV
jgi:hypothetical protein